MGNLNLIGKQAVEVITDIPSSTISIRTKEANEIQKGVVQFATGLEVADGIVDNKVVSAHEMRNAIKDLKTSSFAGIDWVARSSIDLLWISVCYANGLYVAVSQDASDPIMTSPDGITWTRRTAPYGTANLESVCYGKELFVAVRSSNSPFVHISTDGINWNQIAGFYPYNGMWKSVCYGNGLFVAVAKTMSGADGSLQNKIMISSDAMNWSLQQAPNWNWSSVCYGNGLFVAVGNNYVMTSSDGVTWTLRTNPSSSSWKHVCYGNGLFVAVAYSGTGNRVMTSPDGITWTARNAAVNNQWFSVCYGNGLFVAVSYDGTSRVMTSPNGINWTARVSPVDSLWTGVCYGDKKFVAVGDSGSSSTGGIANRVMTSS